MESGSMTEKAASPSLEERARQYANEHPPEPLKCIYCGLAQATWPNVSGVLYCEPCSTSPTKNHTYEITVGGGSNQFQVRQLTDFAQAELERMAKHFDNTCMLTGHEFAAAIRAYAAKGGKS
jgi:hypothetical protein